MTQVGVRSADGWAYRSVRLRSCLMACLSHNLGATQGNRQDAEADVQDVCAAGYGVSAQKFHFCVHWSSWSTDLAEIPTR